MDNDQGQVLRERNEKLMEALGLPAETPLSPVLAAIGRLKEQAALAANLENFVPRADYDALAARAANAESALAQRKAEALEAEIAAAMEQALAEGKITPATRAYHEANCREEGGLERFRAFCAAAPALCGPSGLDGKTPPEAPGKALNADARRVMELFGHTEADLEKYGHDGGEEANHG